MKMLLWFAAAVAAYVVSSWNPAITLSKAIYHKDIRTCGSGNPGFTNFKRTFGNKWAWWVMLLDMCKAGLVVLLFAWLFRFFGYDFQLGAAYTGIFALAGHAYPVWYEWKGGKGFLVTLSVIAVVDWRVGLAAFVLMTILLLTTDYMSLSTVTALLLSPFMLIFMKAKPVAIVIVSVMVLFVAVRHKENFKRLIAGTEKHFLRKPKEEQQ